MVTSSYPETDFLTRLTVKRLAELNQTRARLAALESRSGLLAEYELERKKLDILSRLQERYGELAPALSDAGFHVSELKSYLQSVYDADVLADEALRTITTQHAVSYAVNTLDRMSEPGRYSMEGAAGVLELASSALCMFSQRPSAGEAFSEAGAAAVLIKILSPMYPPVVVVNAANTAGNMAGDVDFRIAFRSAGGVGALVRLLRRDCEAAVQTAAAAALSLLAARDLVVQDSARYLGGIDLLVDLLAQGDAYTAETARYCLLSLRHGNTKNQAEVISAIRANVGLVRNVKRLDMASDLLRFEESTPRARAPTYGITSPYHAYSPIASLLTSSAAAAAAARSPSPSKYTLLPAARTPDSYRRPRTAAPAAMASSYRSPRGGDLTGVAKSLDFGATSTSSAFGKFSPTGKYLSPPKTALEAVLEQQAQARASISYAAASGADDDALVGSLLPQVDSDLLRRKHLMLYSAEELSTMLSEGAGFDKLDLRSFRLHNVSGLDLLDMSESAMSLKLLLPPAKVRKLRALQRAVACYDRIATLPRQGRLSEVELRLYLASHGCSVAEVDKLVKLFRSLVRTDRLDFVTFWDFVSGYDWISQAFRIYNVPRLGRSAGRCVV